jgi:hypothetical protein
MTSHRSGHVPHRLRIAVPAALVLLLADCTTKTLAVEHLISRRRISPVRSSAISSASRWRTTRAPQWGSPSDPEHVGC